MLSLSSLWRYEDSWLVPFAQSLLRLLGFIFCVSAVALAFGGVFLILMCKTYGCFFPESFLSLPGWLAFAAAIVLLPAGLLASSISARSSRYRQGTLMYLLQLLLCLEMSSAILAHSYTPRLASEIQRTMGHLVYQYNGTHSQGPGSRAVDVVQRKLQCCGVQNYTDWLKATAASWPLLAEEARVPESCCKEKYPHCRGDLGHLEQIFQEGCLKKLEDRLHVIMLYVFWSCIVIGILELLASVSNGILMRDQLLYDYSFLDSSVVSQASRRWQCC